MGRGLGASSGCSGSGLRGLSLQARLLGQMIERFPQRIGQDADEDMGLSSNTVVMPDRPQELAHS